MKSGIGLMLVALQGLLAEYGRLRQPVTVLLVSDEEVGSDSSRTSLSIAGQEVICGFRLRTVVRTGRRGKDGQKRRGGI